VRSRIADRTAQHLEECDAPAAALRGQGFEVLEAADADSAITAMKFNPDVVLVISDIRMRSAEDGMVLARYVRKHHPGVVLIMASAHQLPSIKDNHCFASSPVRGRCLCSPR
jgi:DNA-binding NtrC family response regulator